uniref:BHLH domain-containing protein n=1 Tax=Trichobilharzia regenti TaxID=157069 RepID=A0AA85JJV4_TRIRE|nr:unnamed protein product [Trichobilharzia regenti]
MLNTLEKNEIHSYAYKNNDLFSTSSEFTRLFSILLLQQQQRHQEEQQEQQQPPPQNLKLTDEEIRQKPPNQTTVPMEENSLIYNFMYRTESSVNTPPPPTTTTAEEAHNQKERLLLQEKTKQQLKFGIDTILGCCVDRSQHQPAKSLNEITNHLKKILEMRTEQLSVKTISNTVTVNETSISTNISPNESKFLVNNGINITNNTSKNMMLPPPELIKQMSVSLLAQSSTTSFVSAFPNLQDHQYSPALCIQPPLPLPYLSHGPFPFIVKTTASESSGSTSSSSTSSSSSSSSYLSPTLPKEQVSLNESPIKSWTNSQLFSNLKQPPESQTLHVNKTPDLNRLDLGYLSNDAGVNVIKTSLTLDLLKSIGPVEFINNGAGIKNPLACSTKFEREWLNRLYASQIGPNEYVCKACGKHFQILRLLTRHIKCHSQLHRYLCKFCFKGFNDTFDLKRHTRTHTVHKNNCLEYINHTHIH